jgi:NADH-quinone oxidoreductase subunit C
MTIKLNTSEVAARLKTQIGEGFNASDDYIEIAPALLAKSAEYLKTAFDLDFCDMITAADYPDRFELIYRLISLKNNSFASIKVRLDHVKPSVPSLANLWQGANFQEREIFDLFGIEFSGHPDLRRIVLWEGYEGHPLRKDFKDKVYGARD